LRNIGDPLRIEECHHFFPAHVASLSTPVAYRDCQSDDGVEPGFAIVFPVRGYFDWLINAFPRRKNTKFLQILI
jgi:hypothetical protein